MQISITILLAFLCLNLQAQEQKCAKYDEAMKNGYEYLSKKNYDKALIEFQAAQVAARECGKATDTPAIKLREVFKGLKAQRDEAIEAKKEAEQTKKAAVISAGKTKIALNKADSSYNQAEKLIHAFYFYDGKFALAFKEKYGFIDTLGNAVIDYKYDKAE